jgi:hypothetical protein
MPIGRFMEYCHDNAATARVMEFALHGLNVPLTVCFATVCSSCVHHVIPSYRRDLLSERRDWLGAVSDKGLCGEITDHQ